jgi:hypothetical protein
VLKRAGLGLMPRIWGEFGVYGEQVDWSLKRPVGRGERSGAAWGLFVVESGALWREACTLLLGWGSLIAAFGSEAQARREAVNVGRRDAMVRA